MPSDESNSSIIRVEGSPEGVHKVKQELLEMVSKLVGGVIFCGCLCVLVVVVVVVVVIIV